MRLIKKIKWQLLKLLLIIANITRLLGIFWCGYTALLYYGWEILEALLDYGTIKVVPVEIYVKIVFWSLLGLGLFFLSEPISNIKDWVQDRIFENSKFYFSVDKLNKFQQDMMEGKFSNYTFKEAYALSKALENEGKEVLTDSSRYDSTNQSSNDVEYEDIERRVRMEDEEKILSLQEIKKFTHRGVSEPLKELDKLVGLDAVQEQVKKMQTRYLFEAKRKKQGASSELSTCNHMCFIGPPGTGKTTVARIMSGILYDLKIIKKNKVIEIGGNDLQGQYVGYTGKRTRAIVEAAKGGVLFIDEAYSLSYGGYADEALGELVKAMEDYKDELVVIFAGYENEMKDFLKRNPGMSSRIKTYIYFQNYSSEVLSDILVSMANKAKYTITKELKNVYVEYAEQILLQADDFGNARTVRGDLDAIIEKHADNVMSRKVDESQLDILDVVDFPYFKKN